MEFKKLKTNFINDIGVLSGNFVIQMHQEYYRNNTVQNFKILGKYIFGKSN